ncbi:glycosyltransferase family 2 protein [Geobacter sp.]|uniref:glycosyltransferase family 2 protein n=1 Tax=Geobacter sp. TaxID=46610 RepID=UPI00261D4D1C|nr:glycosyltransferase family 2 protein [Geobacter sp.]
MFSVSVVIPTFNGRDLLLKNLPPLFEALERIDTTWEIIVVDDASSDDSVRMLQDLFPTVVVMRNHRNLGFAETINRGIFAAKHEIVFALNNDVVVEPDVLQRILPRFRDESIFAVTPNVLDPTTKHQQAIYKLRPGFCWFRDTCLPAPPNGDEIPLFFASGGSSCYDRKKLWELGGFSLLYAPFYVEDVDLSYHAWKRGWKCVMEPAATVWHPVNSTIRKYHRQRKIKFLIARNKHIFMWVNITDPVLIFRYFLFLLPSLVWDVLSFRKYKLVGMFMALERLATIVRERRRRRPTFSRRDGTIIASVR